MCLKKLMIYIISITYRSSLIFFNRFSILINICLIQSNITITFNLLCLAHHIWFLKSTILNNPNPIYIKSDFELKIISIYFELQDVVYLYIIVCWHHLTALLICHLHRLTTHKYTHTHMHASDPSTTRIPPRNDKHLLAFA